MKKKIILRLRQLVFFVGFIIFVSCSENIDNKQTQEQNRPTALLAKSLLADAGDIQTVSVGDVVHLDASQSTGDNIDFHWLFKTVPDNSTVHLSDYEVSQPQFVAEYAGNFVLQLHVQDVFGDIEDDLVAIKVVDNSLQGDVQPDYHKLISSTCELCHNGVEASDRPVSHISSSRECVLCHSPDYWLPTIAVDHEQVIGNCSSCHNGQIAPGKNETHTATAEECNECHNPGVTFKVYETSTFARHLRNSDGGFRGLRAVFGSDFFTNRESINRDDDSSGNRRSNSGNDDGDDDDDDNRRGSSGGDDDGDEEDDDHPSVSGRECTECHQQPNDHFPTTDNCRACHTTDDWDRIITVAHAEVIGGCSSCHRKPAGHVPTSAECNTCHNTQSWKGVVGGGAGGGPSGAFNHSALAVGTLCFSCHNGIAAMGKNIGHFATTDICRNCHLTSTFAPAFQVDHNEVLGLCGSCHNGTVALGKDPAHIPTTDLCEDCHSTAMFVPAIVVDHNEVVGSCGKCHNNRIAVGKPALHIPTTDMCGACHATNRFTPAIVFDHNESLGTCLSCHDGVVAIGKPATHIVTMDDCAACHSIVTWLIAGTLPAKQPANTFDHSTLIADAKCSVCHNGAIAVGKSTAHVATTAKCGVCHSTFTFVIGPAAKQ